MQVEKQAETISILFTEERHNKKVNSKFCELFGRSERNLEGELTSQDMDLVCSIQVVVEEVVVKAAGTARKVTGEKNLCLAGGVALNCG